MPPPAGVLTKYWYLACEGILGKDAWDARLIKRLIHRPAIILALSKLAIEFPPLPSLPLPLIGCFGILTASFGIFGFYLCDFCAF